MSVRRVVLGAGGCKLQQLNFPEEENCRLLRKVFKYLGTMLQAGMSRVRDSIKGIKFFNLCDLFVRIGRGVYSASKRNEYQKQENNVCWEYSAAGA
jgi:hypothetical protein